MSLISIIIPTYKPLDYIDDCFKSLALQTCDISIFETVVILNGEREPYYSIIESAIKKYDIKYKLIYTDIVGVSNARNIALDYIVKTDCQYVVFLDDDDKLSVNFIEKCLSKANKNEIVVSNIKTFNQSDEEEYGSDYISKCFMKNQEKNYNLVSFRSFLSSVCAKFIPIGIIAETRFDTNFALGEDSLFGFEISNKIQKIVLSDKDCIYYRRLRPFSASRKPSKKLQLVFNSLKICQKYSQLYFNGSNYNLKLYFTRILAEFKYIFKILLSSNNFF